MIDVKMVIIGLVIFAIGVVVVVIGTFLEGATQSGAYAIGISAVIVGLIFLIKGAKS